MGLFDWLFRRRRPDTATQYTDTTPSGGSAEERPQQESESRGMEVGGSASEQSGGVDVGGSASESGGGGDGGGGGNGGGGGGE
jgi:hypothetical protein